MNRAAELIAALRDSDEGARFQAARELVRLGPRAAEAVPALVQALLDPSGPVVDSVMWALEATGAAGLDATMAALASNDPRLRALCARSLGRYGTHMAKRFHALRRCLDDPAAEVRDAAAIALAEVLKRHMEAVQAVPGLEVERVGSVLIQRFLVGLESPVASKRAWAAHELGMLGVLFGSPQTDRLAEIATRDPDEKPRHDAFWALGWLCRGGSNEARAELERLAGLPGRCGEDARSTLEWSLDTHDS